MWVNLHKMGRKGLPEPLVRPKAYDVKITNNYEYFAALHRKDFTEMLPTSEYLFMYQLAATRSFTWSPRVKIVNVLIQDKDTSIPNLICSAVLE